MEFDTNEAKMNALIEAGRKALEKYLINIGSIYSLATPINCQLAEINVNEAKIRMLIESGQEIVKNHYQKRSFDISTRPEIEAK